MMRGGGGSGSGSGSGLGLGLPLPRPNPEKPLEDLTHQDIMQLTREDCRRYLKEKGMRRPSWNKSQAIQQVLSLKNLFHSTPENGEEVEAQPEPSPLPHLDWLAEAELPVLATQPPTISAQNDPSTRQSGAQLTIFYSGNVNVYNDVPAEKAQAIMLLAGAANHLPCSRMPNIQDAPYPNTNTNTNTTTTTTTTTSQVHKEKPVTRKASLQRFLEKKKDRGRCKTGASASKKQPPMLMGMFMHPSYWSEAGKKKATKSTPTTTPPHTPSSDEQRKSMIQNCSS